MRFIASARGVRANAVWLAAPLDLAGAGWMVPAHAQDAVCAEVKIETKQKLSLEGQSLEGAHARACLLQLLPDGSRLGTIGYRSRNVRGDVCARNAGRWG